MDANYLATMHPVRYGRRKTRIQSMRAAQNPLSNDRLSAKAIPARRAILIFAERLCLDLARRSFPRNLSPLLRTQAFTSDDKVDVHLFTAGSCSGNPGKYVHQQKGSTFGQKLENAVATIQALGYDEVVLVGRDCPSLRSHDIEQAFALLQVKTLVIGPDHRGGCYLIGLRTSDRQLLSGIQWKRNTDCAQLRGRCPLEAVTLLDVKHDVDSWSDLHLISKAADDFGRLAEFVLLLFSPPYIACPSLSSRDSWLSQLARWQLPPPLAA